MSIVDLYDSEFKARNKGHFSAIVRVALADGVVEPEERLFLDKLAAQLEISAEEYDEILENPLKYPINPPAMHHQRLERLYDLGRMVYIDQKLGDRRKTVLRRFALALGFTPGNAEYIIDKALKVIASGADLDTFVDEMTHMNR